MATSTAVTETSSTTLPDLPDDALLTILSLLPPPDAAAAACSCRRLAAAFSSPSLPLSLSLLLHLPLPHLPLISGDAGPTASRRHFLSLHRLHRLSGLWRSLSSGGAAASSSLAAFEWAPHATLAASLLTPSHGFAVTKTPFLKLSITSAGETVGTLGELSVCVNFVGNNHIVVEAAGEEEEEVRIEGSSPPASAVLEIYRHFANRTSPAGRRMRRQERGRQGRRRGGGWEAQHFVRIAQCEPTKARPLQGLWKGICENRTLEFYLVAYDDIGGITCRVSDAGGQFSGYSPVFWTTNTTFLEPPFSEEELDLYSSREHIQGLASNQKGIRNRVISRILCINSSYELVIPDLSGSLDDLRNVEGRIWQYEDGTFGFGFLGNNSIIDLRHVTSDGCILDAVQ